MPNIRRVRRRVRSSSADSNRQGSGQGEEEEEEDNEEARLRAAQRRVLRAEELAAEREEEIRRLRAQLNAQNANAGHPARRNRPGGRNQPATPPANPPANPPGRQHNNQCRGQPANRTGTPEGEQPQNAPDPARAERLFKISHNRSLVRQAGRRCCVLHHPFMEEDFLIDNAVQQALPQILTDLENKLAEDAEHEDEGGDAEDNFWAVDRFELAEPVEIVREILSTLPLELGRLWLDPKFQKLFHTGYRKMKSEAVSGVANARHVVFKMTDEEFGERSDDRKRGAAAKALLDDNKYLFSPSTEAELQEARANRRDPPRGPHFFRHECLVKLVFLLQKALLIAPLPRPASLAAPCGR
ncbi:hypothetical protein FRC08_018785 [Ceratobasidium sp. 394]|nr:hypothetical protein FRC08_018785 [Ceratobasidium sp. 394]